MFVVFWQSDKDRTQFLFLMKEHTFFFSHIPFSALLLCLRLAFGKYLKIIYEIYFIKRIQRLFNIFVIFSALRVENIHCDVRLWVITFQINQCHKLQRSQYKYSKKMAECKHSARINEMKWNKICAQVSNRLRIAFTSQCKNNILWHDTSMLWKAIFIQCDREFRRGKWFSHFDMRRSLTVNCINQQQPVVNSPKPKKFSIVRKTQTIKKHIHKPIFNLRQYHSRFTYHR